MLKLIWVSQTEEKNINKLKKKILKLIDESTCRHRDLFTNFCVKGRYSANILTKATEELIHERRIKLTGTDTYSKKFKRGDNQ